MYIKSIELKNFWSFEHLFIEFKSTKPSDDHKYDDEHKDGDELKDSEELGDGDELVDEDELEDDGDEHKDTDVNAAIIVGPSGSGKTNIMRAFHQIISAFPEKFLLQPHQQLPDSKSRAQLNFWLSTEDRQVLIELCALHVSYEFRVIEAHS